VKNRLRVPVLLSLLAAVALVAGPATASAKPRRHRVDMTAATKMSGGSVIPGPAIDRGTTSGKPFDDGRIKLTVQIDLATQSATGTFRIRDAEGTAFGTFDMDMTLDIPGNSVDFNGTADITGGKGAYKGIKAKGLKAHDHNTLDGQNGVVSVDGFARY
jgi:hypothetical protein